MNDHSTRIFNYVRDRVHGEFPSCLCTTSPTWGQEESLPALHLSFAFPSGDDETRDSSDTEVWTRTTCDAEAFSGTSAQEDRAILALADQAMGECGFRRSAWHEAPNAADPSVRRFQATWRARLDASGNAAKW